MCWRFNIIRVALCFCRLKFFLFRWKVRREVVWVVKAKKNSQEELMIMNKHGNHTLRKLRRGKLQGNSALHVKECLESHAMRAASNVSWNSMILVSSFPNRSPQHSLSEKHRKPEDRTFPLRFSQKRVVPKALVSRENPLHDCQDDVWFFFDFFRSPAEKFCRDHKGKSINRKRRAEEAFKVFPRRLLMSSSILKFGETPLKDLPCKSTSPHDEEIPLKRRWNKEKQRAHQFGGKTSRELQPFLLCCWFYFRSSSFCCWRQ